MLWNKESNFLFDYESNDYTISNTSALSEGILMRVDKSIEFNSHHYNMYFPNQTYIATIKVKEDANYELYFEGEADLKKYNFKSFEENQWLVFRHSFTNLNNSFKIKEGDTIKFGKVNFTVREINLKENTFKKIEKGILDNKNNLNDKNNLPVSVVVTNNDVIVINKKKRSNTVCRICLCDDNELDNPLICPCNCSGTMKYIHLLCLKQWLNTKIKIKESTHLIIYSFPLIVCELCKSVIPELIRVREELYSLLDFKKPSSNYLMMECVSLTENDSKNIFIVDMKNIDSLRIGRANDSDIKITDISVSRYHAKLKIVNNNFYIQDNNSKFGTMIKVENQMNILPNKQLALQIGKYLAIFQVRKTFCAYLTCYSFKEYNISDYNECLDKKYIKKKDKIIEIGYSNSVQVSNYESEKKENDRDNLEAFSSKNPPYSINNNDKYDEMNRSNLFTSVCLPIKNKTKDENYDDSSFNPVSDTSRRNFISGVNMSSNNFIPSGIVSRRDNSEIEKEIELKEIDFITKIKCSVEINKNDYISKNDVTVDQSSCRPSKSKKYNSEENQINKSSRLNINEHNSVIFNSEKNNDLRPPKEMSKNLFIINPKNNKITTIKNEFIKRISNSDIRKNLDYDENNLEIGEFNSEKIGNSFADNIMINNVELKERSEKQIIDIVIKDDLIENYKPVENKFNTKEIVNSSQHNQELKTIDIKRDYEEVSKKEIVIKFEKQDENIINDDNKILINDSKDEIHKLAKEEYSEYLKKEEKFIIPNKIAKNFLRTDENFKELQLSTEKNIYNPEIRFITDRNHYEPSINHNSLNL